MFIGGLSYDTKVQGLINFLAENNVHPEDTRIVSRNEQSKGFGFADFSSEEESAKCIESMNGQELDGRTLRCNIEPPGGLRQKRKQRENNFDNEETPSKLLMIKNLSWNTDNDSLRSMFPDAFDARVGRFRDSGKSRGFAFVEFDDIECATKAREAYNGKDIDGREVNIVFATF